MDAQVFTVEQWLRVCRVVRRTCFGPTARRLPATSPCDAAAAITCELWLVNFMLHDTNYILRAHQMHTNTHTHTQLYRPFQYLSTSFGYLLINLPPYIIFSHCYWLVQRCQCRVSSTTKQIDDEYLTYSTQHNTTAYTQDHINLCSQLLASKCLHTVSK